ncbi:hypothetical protein EK21DRAFT_23103, partial [Setomelanomma holmii]
LSYVWGPSGDNRPIKLNSKSFMVRKNLWDFLYAASIESHRVFTTGCFRSIWIDALCIDHDSVLERNHQVQQMGPICSNAANVVAWLG